MEIKIGNYVRNQYGIAKVIDIEKNNGINILVFDKPICYLVNKDTGEILKDKFINRLPLTKEIDINRIKYGKLIDLIEVGDLVNGSWVTEIKDGKPYHEDSNDPYYSYYYEDDGIYTVLTKEQFSQMEYTINE